MQKELEYVKFMLHTLFHPIRGFYEIKAEKKGRLWIALFGIILVALTSVFTQQVTAFLFNPYKYLNPNLVFAVTQIGVIFLLFCVGNWSITCLLDGEGSFKDIVMVFGYSCYAMVLIQVPIAIITNLCSFGEASLINLMIAFSYIWFVYLLFFGIMTVHQYSLIKMITTTILTVVAMLAIVFIYLLFFSFISRIIAFILAVFKEINFRLL